MTNMRFSQMQLPGCQATGREPKVTDLICLSAIDLLGVVGSRRGACVAIRRSTHNTSVLANPACLVSARHMCVIAIQARFLETAPRAVAKHQGAFVFQSPVSGVYKSEYYTRARYERHVCSQPNVRVLSCGNPIHGGSHQRTIPEASNLKPIPKPCDLQLRIPEHLGAEARMRARIGPKPSAETCARSRAA